MFIWTMVKVFLSIFLFLTINANKFYQVTIVQRNLIHHQVQLRSSKKQIDKLKVWAYICKTIKLSQAHHHLLQRVVLYTCSGSILYTSIAYCLFHWMAMSENILLLSHSSYLLGLINSGTLGTISHFEFDICLLFPFNTIVEEL